MRCSFSVGALAALLSACSSGGVAVDPKEPWGWNDMPSLLDGDANLKFADLPLEGQAEPAPWAGTYWPTYKDSINDDWGGYGSPSEKYGQAFGLEDFPDRMSKYSGIDAHSSRKSCKTSSDCNTDADSTDDDGTCAIRDGEDEGVCIPTWWGICHAWAPVAIMEEEPVSPVRYGEVEFKVNDLKALLTSSYDEGLETDFMSGRCNDNIEEGDLDEYGRPTATECRNTNAGAFHVIATNLLGIDKTSFVEDRTIGLEVWNQPVRGYEVHENREVTKDEALDLIGVPAPLVDADGNTIERTYTFNEKAERWIYVRMTLEYIGESSQSTDGNLSGSIDSYTHDDDYEYILELDKDGIILGGEWVGDSKTAHPDFLWRGVSKRASTIQQEGSDPKDGMRWDDVQFLMQISKGEIEGVLTATDLDVGDLVVTEVLPNPEGDDDSQEWIEIRNTTESWVDLRDVRLVDEDGQDGAVRYTTRVAPGGVVVVGRGDIDSFEGDASPEGYYGTATVLDNTGGSLRLVAGLLEIDVTPSWSDADSGVSFVRQGDTWCESTPNPGQDQGC